MTKFYPALAKITSNLLTIALTLGIGLTSRHMDAQTWQDLPQPIGNLVRVWDVSGPLPFPVQPPPPAQQPYPLPATPIDEVNYIIAQWDSNVSYLTRPFGTNIAATEIVITQPQHFVRVYAPDFGSSKNGTYFFKSQYVRGLTPAQIKDVFALPALPTHIVNVDVAQADPSSGKENALWTGIAGPIPGFGNGGGVQNKIISDFQGTHYFPNYQFFLGVRDHPQLIGAKALSYLPMAGKGNARHLAAYLDQFIPGFYTDLDYVYTALDYINWVDYGPDPIRRALHQISSERYRSLPFVVMRNSILFSDRLLDLNYPLDCCDPCVSPFECQPLYKNARINFSVIGEWGKQFTDGYYYGGRYQSRGFLANADCQILPDLSVGFAAAGFNNPIEWDRHGGHVRLKSALFGLYSHYTCGSFFVDGLISGGVNKAHAKRTIRFFGVDRVARSDPRGDDLELHMQCGSNMFCGKLNFIPRMRVSYLYENQHAFTERGADSLNLHVHSFDNQTLRTYIEAELSNTFEYCFGNVMPQIKAGWAHYCLLSAGRIPADLAELGGSFSTYVYRRNRDSFVADMAMDVAFRNGLGLQFCYEAEIGNAFIAQSVKLGVNWDL